MANKYNTADDGGLIRHYNAAYYKPGWGGRTNNDKQWDRMGAYWRYALFEKTGIPPNAHVLDFGAGLGLISSKLPSCTCYDASEYARRELKSRGRQVIDSLDETNEGQFDVILLSHVLEHVLYPAETLRRLASKLVRGGMMLLVLPVETRTEQMFSSVDASNHLCCWTPQTIGNLVAACHLNVQSQRFLFGPFGLRLLREVLRLDRERAVQFSYVLGQLKRNRTSKSILTVVTRPESGMAAYGQNK